MNNEIYIIARPAQFFTATLFENGQDLVREVTYWEMDSLMNDQFKNYIDRIVKLVTQKEMSILPGHLAFNIVMMINI